MQKREKLLAIAVGALAILFVSYYGFTKYQTAHEQRTNKLAALQSELDDRNRDLLLGRRAANKLTDYERRSLPSEGSAAVTQYRNWLISLLNSTDLSDGSVQGREESARGNTYKMLSFSVNANGTLDQLTHFLHNFYSVDHLHQIRSLHLKPIDKSNRLNLSIAVQALALPTASSPTELKDQPNSRLELAELASYEKDLVGRNFFAAYQPPAPPQPVQVAETPRPPEFDASRLTQVTGVVDNGNSTQVWLIDRTTGKLLRLSAGDTFDIGGFQGIVKQIDHRRMELESDGKRMTVALGDSLYDASPLESAPEISSTSTASTSDSL